VYAVITRADIDTQRPDEAAAMLTDMVVPATKAAPGFSSGYWMRSADHPQGLSVVLFESQAAAAAAAEAQGSGPPPGSPVRQVSVEVMEVTVSA
jgi:hypothetical protein